MKITDSIFNHRSPGEMLEDDGNLRDEQVPDDVKRSKADKVSAGTVVIYAFDKHSYCVGKVLTPVRHSTDARWSH